MELPEIDDIKNDVLSIEARLESLADDIDSFVGREADEARHLIIAAQESVGRARDAIWRMR